MRWARSRAIAVFRRVLGTRERASDEATLVQRIRNAMLRVRSGDPSS